VPGVALVYGLICGVLIGYDKLGGERSVDWAAVAGFTAAFTTLISAGTVVWVFLQWNRQKGGEVIASEAMQTIKDILNLNKVLFSFQYSADPELDPKLKEYRRLLNSIIVSVLYIEESVEIKGLGSEFEKFTMNSESLILLILQEKLDKDILQIHQFTAHQMILSKTIISKLRPYSNYKNKIIFKLDDGN